MSPNPNKGHMDFITCLSVCLFVGHVFCSVCRLKCIKWKQHWMGHVISFLQHDGWHCLFLHLSYLLCTRLKQNYLSKFYETWCGYPLKICDQLLRFWTMYYNFHRHHRNKMVQAKIIVVWLYCPNFYYIFDKNFTGLCIRTEGFDELVRVWVVWPDYQGHWGQIGHAHACCCQFEWI